MLLAAGLGTRLGELSDERPKPMLPVCGIPILRYGIALLVGHGIRDIVVNLHHRPEVIEDEIGDGSAFGARITYVREDPILGTGGGLRNALDLLDPDGDDAPFVSMNGKLIFDLDLTAALEAYAAAGDVAGLLVVRRVPDAAAWGAIDAGPGPDGNLNVRGILGDRGAYMFCGVHVTRPSVIRRLPEGPSCSIRQGYIPWIAAGERVVAYDAGDVYFAEHSTQERYLESNMELLRSPRLRHPPGTLVGIAPDADVAPGATIREPVRIASGARVEDGAVVGPDAVIGAGARVAAGVTVRRSVVWAGASVTSDTVGTVLHC